MRTANKTLVAVVAICAAITLAAPRDTRAAESGLTITPAAATLQLATGSHQQTSEFAITNHYQSAVVLTFAFEPRIGAPSPSRPADYLRISQTSATVAAGETLHQTITALDSAQLGPGSQQADLVISQVNTQASAVGILPSIRMPLVVIKQDGAVSALTLTQFKTPGFAFVLPHSLTTRFYNRGNMIAIARGYITITDARGSTVRKGVLNVASQAVTPQANITLATPLTQLANSTWPGIYRTTISYGLGGGQKIATASASFLYIAWWHVAGLLLLGSAAYLGIKHVFKTRHKQAPSRDPPKKALLIGRDIT